MRKKLARPVSLAEVLPQAMKGAAIEKKVLLYDLTDRWQGLVGVLAARRTTPLKIHGKRLIVGVDGSAWANELSFLKQTLLEKIRQELPHVPIDEIRFQIRD